MHLTIAFLHPGIFIKEIYSDSVAENSELQVSDMLISVNQIQLINMDYDLVGDSSAFNLLISLGFTGYHI